jgi:hypothetical protein
MGAGDDLTHEDFGRSAPMVIVAGHVTVDPEQRESYLAGSMRPVKTYRRRAPRNKQRTAMLSVSVAEYDIAEVRPLVGKGKA